MRENITLSHDTTNNVDDKTSNVTPTRHVITHDKYRSSGVINPRQQLTTYATEEMGETGNKNSKDNNHVCYTASTQQLPAEEIVTLQLRCKLHHQRKTSTIKRPIFTHDRVMGGIVITFFLPYNKVK